MSLIKNLGHVGIICDDFMKMRDFYTRVMGMTVTDEDPDRGSCFLSADPENEHHELALGQARGADHPDGARPATQNVGQISYIVPELASLRELNRRFKAEGIEILRTVTHGISCSIYFHDPENNAGEVYYKTGFIVKQGFSRAIDLETQTDQGIIDFPSHSKPARGHSRAPSFPWGPATNQPGCFSRTDAPLLTMARGAFLRMAVWLIP